MLIVSIFFSFCVLVSPVEISNTNYSLLNNFLYINGKNCDGDSPWLVTEYEKLGVIPLAENNTKCVQATLKSCVNSYPIVFSSGVVELSVYLRLFLNESGLSVTVFNANNVSLLEYKYERLSNDYIEGWNKISLNPEGDFVGYINLRGHAGEGEIIIVDSFQYNGYVKDRKNEPSDTELTHATENSETFNIYKEEVASESQTKELEQNDWLTEDCLINRIKRSNILEAENTQGTENNVDGNDVEDENITTTLGPTTAAEVVSDSPTSDSDQTVNTTPSTASSTTSVDVSNQTNYPDSDEQSNTTTDDLSTAESDSSTTETNVLSNPIIIVLIVVGLFVVFGINTVASYHCGKIRAREENSIHDIIIEEDIQPPQIIPRVKGTVSTFDSGNSSSS